MRGGYLTLDLSNYKISGKTIEISKPFANKKGLYNYLKNNTKPIQVVFSDSVIKGIYNYITGTDYPIVNFNVMTSLPIFNSNTQGSSSENNGKDNINISFFITSTETVSNYVSNYNLFLTVTKDDNIMFTEI